MTDEELKKKLDRLRKKNPTSWIRLTHPGYKKPRLAAFLGWTVEQYDKQWAKDGMIDHELWVELSAYLTRLRNEAKGKK